MVGVPGDRVPGVQIDDGAVGDLDDVVHIVGEKPIDRAHVVTRVERARWNRECAPRTRVDDDTVALGAQDDSGLHRVPIAGQYNSRDHSLGGVVAGLAIFEPGVERRFEQLPKNHVGPAVAPTTERHRDRLRPPLLAPCPSGRFVGCCRTG